MSESHIPHTDSVMDEDPIPEGKKTLWKAFWIIIVVGGAIGILVALNQYCGKPHQPSKTDRFINSVEKIQEDISKMRKDEDKEAQNSGK